MYLYCIMCHFIHPSIQIKKEIIFIYLKRCMYTYTYLYVWTQKNGECDNFFSRKTVIAFSCKTYSNLQKKNSPALFRFFRSSSTCLWTQEHSLCKGSIRNISIKSKKTKVILKRLHIFTKNMKIPPNVDHSKSVLCFRQRCSSRGMPACSTLALWSDALWHLLSSWRNIRGIFVVEIALSLLNATIFSLGGTRNKPISSLIEI